MKTNLVSTSFSLEQIKEQEMLSAIKVALRNNKTVNWVQQDNFLGKVIQGVNGLFIIGHCSVHGTISMPLLWSDGKTLTRPVSEFFIS